MEKDLESWLHKQQLDEQFPNAKSSNLPFDNIEMRNSHFPCAIPCTTAAPTYGAFPMLASSGLRNTKPTQLKEPHGWFYCLPRARQGLIRDMGLHNKFAPKTNVPMVVPAPGNGILGEANAPTFDTRRPAKQFLVFDQTGNKTTMMFSSGIDSSIPRPTAWRRKQACFCDIKDADIGNGSDGCYSGPNLTDDLDDNQESVEGSDMREDSDEIDALLYSEEEDDCDDDGEETSTGHSPNTMTAYEKQDWFDEEGMDEVDSSAGPIKRQKLSESDYRVPSITYTTTRIKLSRSSEYEEDAESSCAGCKPKQYADIGSLPGSKRMRREKIRETVSILQTILPDGKGKDAVMVLDEAINYLKTLKSKAESLSHSGCSD